MSSVAIQVALERAQKRWVLGALALALVFHLFFAWVLGWYKITGLEVPFDHSTPTGPFTVKRIEINPAALKPDQPDPTSRLPNADPPRNPAQFNLDPHLVEKALQAPLPALTVPTVPEPSKVIATTDLSQGLPLVESDSAKISAEISKMQPADIGGGPLTSASMAQNLISSVAGPAQTGTPNGTPGTGGSTPSALPGFAELAPGFRTSGPNLSNLPEPVLLRLPSDVLFDFDSAHLKPEADPLLTKAIGLITKYPQADIQIDGYSDSFGKPDYNVTLSEQRAEAVQAWLRDHITQGGYKFHSLGHGSTNFVVNIHGNVEQQQPNRRVEILIQALKL